MTSLEARFQAFHAKNPAVLEQLQKIALEAAESGRRIGIALIFERLRWISQVETKGDPYRLNNSYRAFYARLLMEREPKLRGFFATRQARTDQAYRARVIGERLEQRARRASRRLQAPLERSLPFGAR